MMRSSQLKDLVATSFPNVEQIEDSIVRFTRSIDDTQFSVCYVDATGRLPESQEALTKYQDEIIGKHYFDGRKSLQWNNYLYFLTSEDGLKDPKTLDLKSLIERDRIYARKFVISQKELASVLEPSDVLSEASGPPSANVLSVWTELLEKAQLERAIFADESLPQRLQKIEEPPRSNAPPRQVKSKRTAANASFIKSVHLNSYRPYPLQRGFSFGVANLIVGPNGVGKTSLLEAIELLYCGINKRNPRKRNSYEIEVEYVDGKTEKATNHRRLQLFRDRNLTWYGRLDVKTNYLYRSFAQFNFLDTDAAVSLSESTSQWEDDLARLLVGPDASEVWRTIERVLEAVRQRIKDLRPRKAQLVEEVGYLQRELKAASSTLNKSDSIRMQLEKLILDTEWSVNRSAKAFLAKDFPLLENTLPLVRQATDLHWVNSPVSLSGLNGFVSEAQKIIDRSTSQFDVLEQIKSKEVRLKNETDNLKRLIEELKIVDAHINADILKKSATESTCKLELERCQDMLARVTEASDTITLFSMEEQRKPIALLLDASASMVHDAETQLKIEQRRYREFLDRRKQSEALSQQFRVLATQIIESTQNHDECPLCHTQFQNDELAKRINMGLNSAIEAEGQEFVQKIGKFEEQVRLAKERRRGLVALQQFSELAELDLSTPLQKVLARANEVSAKTSTLAEEHTRLVEDLSTLSARGISPDTLQEHVSQLAETEFALSEVTKESVEAAREKVDKHLASDIQEIVSLAKKREAIELELENLLSPSAPGLEALKKQYSSTSERLAATQEMAMQVEEAFAQFSWDTSEPLARLAVSGDALSSVARDLRVALSTEGADRAKSQGLLDRKKEVQKRVDEIGPRLERLVSAEKVLADLIENHSLSDAMREAIEANRNAIEAIFSVIHVPTEFQGLGPSFGTLVRKPSGEEAKLNEISTGQRAAFALSVFLAQNSCLRRAPPVLLIDDPIAHVDDLNSLSFLDFLREVALAGNRQIFFATASNTVAGLFERKFDFLGSEKFKRFDMTRDSTAENSSSSKASE